MAILLGGLAMKRNGLFILFLCLFFLFGCNKTQTETAQLEAISVDVSGLADTYYPDTFDLNNVLLVLEFSDGTSKRISVTTEMVDSSDLEKLHLVGEHNIKVTYQGFDAVFFVRIADTDNDLVRLMNRIYETGVSEGSIEDMTYEEWLETIKGEQGLPGENGKQIMFQVAEGYIQWQYQGDAFWTNLIDLAILTGINGRDGENGLDGQEVVFQVAGGYIQWRYSGEDSWNDLIDLVSLIGPAGHDGTDGSHGKQVTFQVTDGYIKWQYVGDDSWTNLIDLATLTGQDGQDGTNGNDGANGVDGREVDFQVAGGHIQWQYSGEDSWNDLIDLVSLIGPAGHDGTDGSDGKQVTFQVIDGYIKWQYKGDDFWNDLIDLATLTGQDGQDGPSGKDGANGVDGREVDFQVTDGFIQWQFIGDSCWKNLIDIATLTGSQGVGILSTSINEVGELIVTYTDDTVVNIGTIFKIHTVNFVGLDGYLIDTQAVISGNQAIEPTAPVIDGYTFTGWDQDFSKITGNMMIQASYQRNTYTIVFETNGGIAIDPISGIEHKTSIILPIPVKAGYHFLGWYTGSSVNDAHFTNMTQVTDDMTLYAHWDSGLYTVKFVDIHGEVLKEMIVSGGEDATAPDAPKVTGFTFIGWTEPFIDVTKDIITKTIYQLNHYTISFESNGGSLVTSITGDYGSIVTEPAQPTLDYYAFLGWYRDPSLTAPYTFSTMPAEDITLYAYWTAIIYSITYHLDDGINGNNPTAYTVEADTLTLDNPTKEGYAFNGWYDNQEYLGNPVTEIESGSTGDIDLYAKWSINQYSVTYITCDDYDPLYHIPLLVGEEIETISLGGMHSSALTSKGRVFTWGYNEYGQLGDGTNTNRSYPTDITSQFDLNEEETIVSISLGADFSSALTSMNRVFTWGKNQFGQLGDNTITHKNTPTDISCLFILNTTEKIAAISAGSEHASALTTEGRIFTWGFNYYGQLGNGTNWPIATGYPSNPTDITSQFVLDTNESIVSISMGGTHSSLLTSEGRMFTWGSNSYGQLGDGTTIEKLSPTDITPEFFLNPGETIASISLGYSLSSAITSTGRVYTWGYNSEANLGDGTKMHRSLPVDITTRFGLNVGETIVSMSLGGNSHSSALTSGGRLFIWGRNTESQLGDGTIEQQTIPEDITSQLQLTSGETVVMMSMGAFHSGSITSNGRVFLWGFNQHGQLGERTLINRATPISIAFKTAYSSETELVDYATLLNECVPSREGYIFDGWYGDQELTEVYIFTTMPAEDLMLYARWSLAE